jgi:hypothetical protein
VHSKIAVILHKCNNSSANASAGAHIKKPCDVSTYFEEEEWRTRQDRAKTSFDVAARVGPSCRNAAALADYKLLGIKIPS